MSFWILICLMQVALERAAEQQVKAFGLNTKVAFGRREISIKEDEWTLVFSSSRKSHYPDFPF